MLSRLKKQFYNFIESDKQYPFLSGFTAGLYPMLYYYGFNFTFVNSWHHLSFFLINFFAIPITIFCVFYFLTLKINALKQFNKYVLSCLGLATFVFLTILIIHGFNYFILTVGTILGLFIGALLHKHSKKIIVIQLLLGLMISVKLLSHLYHYFGSSSQWLEQPDTIESVVFKKKPNIYVIQPDGYIGFSKVDRPPYSFDNSEFKNFLEINGFKIEPNYRSNYYSTLSSNASLFAMKHHYFNNPKYTANELYNSRKIIAGDNPVLSILKKNGYTTNLILENPYMLVNKPKLYYDYCNIDYKDITTLSRGFDEDRNTAEALKKVLKKERTSPNFYFIEKITPGHISNKKNKTPGKDKERSKYLERLENANIWLKEIITIINNEDENALIIIAADHGGFVGLDYFMQCREVQTDISIVNSIYSSLLTIKLPDGFSKFDYQIKSSVNLFRTLFSYLGEDEKYLNFLESNASYTLIDNGDLFGTYRVINDNGEVVLEKKE